MVRSETPLATASYDASPTQRIWYGPGCVQQLAEEIRSHGGTRATLITSNTLATRTDVIEKLVSSLGELAGGGVYHDVQQHVHRESVLAGAEVARSNGADFIVSVGGGSPIDCAKAIHLCLMEGVETPEQMDEWIRRGGRAQHETPVHRVAGHISVSTTLSAAEFTPGGGITDPERQVKEYYGDPRILPVVSFLDPELSIHTPEWLWLSTGIRAVDHAVEMYLSPRANPFTDALTSSALTALNSNLRRTFADPADMDARARAQFAAYMSLTGRGGLGLSHAIGHQLGGHCNVPHGYTSCVILPHVMDFNFPISHARQAQLAGCFGTRIDGMADEEAAREFIVNLRGLISGLGLPTTLRDVDVPREELPSLAHHSANEHGAQNTARPANEEQILGILQAAF